MFGPDIQVVLWLKAVGYWPLILLYCLHASTRTNWQYSVYLRTGFKIHDAVHHLFQRWLRKFINSQRRLSPLLLLRLVRFTLWKVRRLHHFQTMFSQPWSCCDNVYRHRNWYSFFVELYCVWMHFIDLEAYWLLRLHLCIAGSCHLIHCVCFASQ